jgi:hypothetical protein
LAAEERLPVVVEVGEDGVRVERPDDGLVAGRARERFGECLRTAQREADGLVERRVIRVQLDRDVPELAHQAHALGVVPDVGRDDAARVGCAHELGERRVDIGHEVQHEA